MRVIGLRVDGAVSVLVAGKAMVLKQGFCSPPSEERDVLALGGWQTPTAISDTLTQSLQKMLDAARVRPLVTFALDQERDELGRFANGGGGSDSGRRENDGHGGSKTPRAGDRVKVMGRVKGQGRTMTVVDEAPSGSFVIAEDSKGNKASYHVSDLKVHE